MDDVAQLATGLQSNDAATRQQAAERLAQLAEDASPAAAALVASCDDSDESALEWKVAALESLGAPPAEQSNELISLLASDCELSRYWAATLLGRLGEAAGQAATALSARLSADEGNAAGERAAWALAQMGPAAAPAKEALRTAAGSARPRMARFAQQALEAIGG